jgi:hypothetical protein
MARPDLKPILDNFVTTIGSRNTYGGRPVSASIMKMIEVEIRDNGAGVTAPFWLGVLERGRGKRVNNVDHGLWKKIYNWMQKRGMFKSRTPEGKVAEAKGLTWYINKYGNQQFRNKAFVDIYSTAREQAIQEIKAQYGLAINKITKDIQ